MRALTAEDFAGTDETDAGKGCFNFKTAPDQALLKNFKELVATGLEEWKVRRWL